MSSSVCIPRIETTISKEYIFNIFSKLKIGYIERIIEIPLRNDAKHKRIIIKLRWNEMNKTSMNIKTRLEKNETIKVVHDMPWYWKMVATHPEK